MLTDRNVLLSVHLSGGSQCTFWCRVLTDAQKCESAFGGAGESQCTFWCRVLTDLTIHERVIAALGRTKSQCTFWCRVLTDGVESKIRVPLLEVSMHLLVPGAYRLGRSGCEAGVCLGSQCTFWCRVLTDQIPKTAGTTTGFLSQCTFWCRVLTDLSENLLNT